MALELIVSPFAETQRSVGNGSDAWAFIAPAREPNSIWSVIVPTDGTRAANMGTGDFGTSPIFGQLSDKPLLAST